MRQSHISPGTCYQLRCCGPKLRGGLGHKDSVHPGATETSAIEFVQRPVNNPEENAENRDDLMNSFEIVN